MTAFGGGASIFDFTLYGERNWRHVRTISENSPDAPLYVHPSSSIGEYTLAYQGFRGFTLGVIKEELDTMGLKGKRENVFIDLHPIPWLQFEVWRRKETLAGITEDSLGIIHLYADF